MMSEPDLLTELTTLMGRFQYESVVGILQVRLRARPRLDL
ncbi:MAG: hypothetical protein CM1200mP39_16970 [Dehalococcoidia bacterium]|nr:MAG: hypothetical protein CM1200mP39_16970 [Dehalococcoidia bacterium]